MPVMLIGVYESFNKLPGLRAGCVSPIKEQTSISVTHIALDKISLKCLMFGSKTLLHFATV